MWLHKSIYCASAIKTVNSKFGFTPEWAPIQHVHTHTQMVLLLYYYLELWDVHASWCICEYVCYYVELRLILQLVMCLSYRYGRWSTPEHNYLALQKSLCPQGKTKQREMVMLHAVGWDMDVGFVVTEWMTVVKLRLWCDDTRKRFLFQKEPHPYLIR